MKIITSKGQRYLVTSESPRKFRYRQILPNGQLSGESRAWRHQVNGRGDAPTTYGAQQNFTLIATS